MKRFGIMTGCVVMGCVLIASDLTAQTLPITLMVTKKEDRQYDYEYSSRRYRYRSGQDVMCYTVDVLYNGVEPLKNVEVKWYIVVRPPAQSKLAPQVVEGSKTTDLQRGRKFSFDTDVLELGSIWKSSYSGTQTGSKAEVEGYMVEVLVDGKVVRTESNPVGLGARIRQLKSNDKPSAPKRHHF